MLGGGPAKLALKSPHALSLPSVSAVMMGVEIPAENSLRSHLGEQVRG